MTRSPCSSVYTSMFSSLTRPTLRPSLTLVPPRCRSRKLLEPYLPVSLRQYFPSGVRANRFGISEMRVFRVGYLSVKDAEVLPAVATRPLCVSTIHIPGRHLPNFRVTIGNVYQCLRSTMRTSCISNWHTKHIHIMIIGFFVTRESCLDVEHAQCSPALLKSY